MMSEELKPCPFCGAKGSFILDEDHHGEYYALGCSYVECIAHKMFYTESPIDTPIEEAIAAWNHRQGDTGLVEALREYKKLVHAVLLEYMSDTDITALYLQACDKTIYRSKE